MRREHDRRSVFVQLAHDAAQLARPDRVEADRWLVEEEDAGPMQQRSGEMQPLLHAARVAFNALVPTVAEVYQSEELLDSRRDLPRGDRVKLREVAKVVPSRKAVVEAALAAEDEADLAANCLCVAHDVEPEDACGTGCGDEEGGEHLY